MSESSIKADENQCQLENSLGAVSAAGRSHSPSCRGRPEAPSRSREMSHGAPGASSKPVLDKGTAVAAGPPASVRHRAMRQAGSWSAQLALARSLGPLPWIARSQQAPPRLFVRQRLELWAPAQSWMVRLGADVGQGWRWKHRSCGASRIGPIRGREGALPAMNNRRIARQPPRQQGESIGPPQAHRAVH